ncbi:MAG TPA: DUF4221 family protein [Saprospiraceae bacterium]|nr:DUF4221 family protein [Saprospiraceae bacterium]HMP22568.1 DUF4221 family protein [Saprospiraceae bacterium]
MHSIIYFLFVIMLLAGCIRQPDEVFDALCECQNSCAPITLSLKKQVNISTQGLQYDFDIAAVYEKDNQSTLWLYNSYETKFYIYDLVEQQLLDTIRIATVGEHAIPEIFGFQVLTPDSILVHTNHYNQLILLNGQGEKLKTWTIKGDLPNGGRQDGLYYLAVWKDYNNFYYNKSNKQVTFFVLNTGFQASHASENFFYPQFATFDLITSSYLSAYGDYPSIYREKEKSDYRSMFPFTVAEDETWASYYSAHCLYIFQQNRHKRSVCAKSLFLPDRFEFLPAGLRSAERDPQLIPKGAYHNIIYDPWRRLFYRIVLHPLPESIPVNRDWSVRKQATWSIMILDDTGKCLGETAFEPGVYNFDHVFATREGLLISMENPYNPDNEEEMLSFALVDIDELINRK